MIFQRRHGDANVLSLVERKTRFAVLMRNNDRKARAMANTMINALSPLPLDARQSITFDRGLDDISTWLQQRFLSHEALPLVPLIDAPNRTAAC